MFSHYPSEIMHNYIKEAICFHPNTSTASIRMPHVKTALCHYNLHVHNSTIEFSFITLIESNMDKVSTRAHTISCVQLLLLVKQVKVSPTTILSIENLRNFIHNSFMSKNRQVGNSEGADDALGLGTLVSTSVPKVGLRFLRLLLKINKSLCIQTDNIATNGRYCVNKLDLIKC